MKDQADLATEGLTDAMSVQTAEMTEEVAVVEETEDQLVVAVEEDPVARELAEEGASTGFKVIIQFRLRTPVRFYKAL